MSQVPIDLSPTHARLGGGGGGGGEIAQLIQIQKQKVRQSNVSNTP